MRERMRDLVAAPGEEAKEATSVWCERRAPPLSSCISGAAVTHVAEEIGAFHCFLEFYRSTNPLFLQSKGLIKLKSLVFNIFY